MAGSTDNLPRILIIDDDSELSSVLQAALELQCDAVVSHNWMDARSRLREERFALIILDLYLPDAAVLEPLERIREIDPDYPVILMSGHCEEGDPLLDRAMRLGVNTILKKPFELEKLQAQITSQLRPRAE